jgi:hypothetical protein
VRGIREYVLRLELDGKLSCMKDLWGWVTHAMNTVIFDVFAMLDLFAGVYGGREGARE